MIKLFKTMAIASIGTSIIWAIGFGSNAANLVQDANLVRKVVPVKTNLLAQSSSVEKVLLGLPRPKGAPAKLGAIASGNAYQQKAINFQIGSLPQPALDFYRQALTSLGYQERTINATTGDWGFSVVFDAPVSVILPPIDPSKKAVLVIQGTALSKSSLNLNLRFEEI
jgi:hypothetical protein